MPPLVELLTHADKLTRLAAEVLTGKFSLSQDAQAVGVFVPGRVEFLGKHTDYAGGRSLLLTVERGFRLAAVARGDRVVRICAGASGDDVRQFTIGQRPDHVGGDWVRYAATVIDRLALNFADDGELKGTDIAFISDLPVAAGLGSSSALMTGVFLAFSALNRLDRRERYQRQITGPLKLAEYLGCIENGQSYGMLAGQSGVGTFGGSEDHTAMLCCSEGRLSQFSFAPATFERNIPFPAGLALVVGSSGVCAVKTADALGKYNRVALRAVKAVEAYNRATDSSYRNLREIAQAIGPEGLSDALRAVREGTELRELLMDLPARFEQFFIEDQWLIPAVGDALVAKGDLPSMADLIDVSQEYADRGLGNQIDQTIFLQRSARKLGALAASAFGAGFGGSVWALVERERTAAFIEAWRSAYAGMFPHDAAQSDFFATGPSRPAYVWSE